jgi:hypothetical protein
MKYPNLAKQAQAIELLALGGYTCEKVAQIVGVHINTISNWRKDPMFMDAVIEQAKRNLYARLPTVLDRLADEAEQGHHQHIQLFLRYLERMEDRASAVDERTITFSWRTSAPALEMPLRQEGYPDAGAIPPIGGYDPFLKSGGRPDSPLQRPPDSIVITSNRQEDDA